MNTSIQKMNIFSVKADQLLKYASVCSLLIYLGSIIYNVLYYSGFNIQILNYIDWSESLLLFIPQFFEILFLVLLVTPIIFYSCHFTFLFFMRKFERVLKKLTWMHWIIICIESLSVLLLPGSKSNNFPASNQSMMPYVIVFDLIFTTGYLILAQYTFKSKIKIRFVHMLPFMLFIYLVQLLYVSYTEMLKVMNGVPNEFVSFKYKDSVTVTTDKDLLFVGQTHNYLFLYNKKTKTSMVYSREKADQLQFTKTRKSSL